MASCSNSYGRFFNMSVQALQEYLTVRGISVSGYKKSRIDCKNIFGRGNESFHHYEQ